MKFIAALMATIVCGLSSAQAAQTDFAQTLARVQNSNWKGTFNYKALGITCKGPLKVKFFPMQTEDFSDGNMTVSYRHDADFSQNPDAFCSVLGKALSTVDVKNCTKTFPTKYSPEEDKMVPFRTIILRGDKAVVSSPSCNVFKKTVKRGELDLSKADLSVDSTKLDLTISLNVDLGILGKIDVDLNYDLERQ